MGTMEGTVVNILAPDEQAYFHIMGMIAAEQEIIVADKYDLTIRTGPISDELHEQLEHMDAVVHTS